MANNNPLLNSNIHKYFLRPFSKLQLIHSTQVLYFLIGKMLSMLIVCYMPLDYLLNTFLALKRALLTLSIYGQMKKKTFLLLEF